MKAQASAFLAKARALLDQAGTMLGVDLTEAAGRTAYLAGFHAAQALIIERTGRIYKSHSGAQREFSRLAKDEPGVDRELLAFLGRTYNLKAIADYETGPGSEVTVEQAQQAIATASRFIACIEALLA